MNQSHLKDNERRANLKNIESKIIWDALLQRYNSNCKIY